MKSNVDFLKLLKILEKISRSMNLFGGKVGRMLKSIITFYEGIKQFIKGKEKRSFSLLAISLGKIIRVIFSLCIMKVRKKKKLR